MPPSRVLRGRVLACRPSSPLTTYSRPGPRGSPTARALAATRRPRPAPPGRRPRLGPRRLRERERDAPRARQRAVRRCTPPPRSATRPRDGAAPCRRASSWRIGTDRYRRASFGAIAIAIMRRRSPGIFRPFAIGELVGYKPCAILAASWWVSGDGQCRDETQ
jgi:hypothetical protein